MQTTTNYRLKKPDGSDPVNVSDFNENADTIDTELAGRVKSAGGDISNTKITAADSITGDFPVPAAGDTAKGFLGKMKKFCSDFNSFKDGIITLGKLANNGLTTEEGYALDARYGKTLTDQLARLNLDLKRKSFNSIDIKTLSEGKYYVSHPINAPTSLTSYVNVKESPFADEQRKSIEVVPATGNTKYIARLSDNGMWSAWDSFVLNTDLTKYVSSADNTQKLSLYYNPTSKKIHLNVNGTVVGFVDVLSS